MTKSRFARSIHNQGISNIEDDIIRGTFPKYDRGMSSIITEQFKMRKPMNCNQEIFCGWFTARIYVGNRLEGRYKFDCTSFDVPYFTEDGNEQTKVTKIN